MYRCINSCTTTDYKSKRYYRGDKITKLIYNELNYLDQSNFELIKENIVSDVIDSVIDIITPSFFSSNSDSGSTDSVSSTDFGGGDFGGGGSGSDF